MQIQKSTTNATIHTYTETQIHKDNHTRIQIQQPHLQAYNYKHKQLTKHTHIQTCTCKPTFTILGDTCNKLTFIHIYKHTHIHIHKINHTIIQITETNTQSNTQLYTYTNTQAHTYTYTNTRTRT